MNKCSCCEEETHRLPQCKYECINQVVLCGQCLSDEYFFTNHFIYHKGEYVCWYCYENMIDFYDKNNSFNRTLSI